MGPSKTCIVILATFLRYVAVTRGQGDQTSSVCRSRQYRMLTVQQQNEHQCLILEQLHQDLDQEKSMLKSQYQDLYTMISTFQASMYRKMSSLSNPSRDSTKSMPNLKDVPLVRDCSELQMHGITLSGVYPVRLPNRKIVNIWCDMETSNGGWTTVQRRVDGSVNFTRHWDEYAFGFGNVNSEYWLGNENLYWLSHNKNYSIQFDLWDWEDNYAYALYDYFRVENEQKNYQLTIQGYSGTAGDAMFPYHNNMKFSTHDRDNDEWHSSCAKKDQSGWWFKACGYASLNGVYLQNGMGELAPDGVIKGILWSKWKKEYGYSMKRTEIKIKPVIQIQYEQEQSSKYDSRNDNNVAESTETADDEIVTDSTEKDTERGDGDEDNTENDKTSQKTTIKTTTTEPPDYSQENYEYDYYQ